ncbi:MAG: DUF6898 family protein [Alphaproteobacteria bacterium]
MARLPHAKARSMAGDSMIFEFSAVGNAVKVCVVDPDAGLEVSIVRPANAGEEALRRTVMAKRRYMLDKRQPAPLGCGGVFV